MSRVMSNKVFSATLTVLALAFLPTRAEALRAEDPCVTAADMCKRWYTEKLEGDDDFAPERAFEKCVTPNVPATWRKDCPKQEMDNLKRELKLIQVRKIDPQFDAEGKFMVHAKFTSLQDCKSKWNRQLNVPESTSVFAGFKDNVDADTICKRLYPNSSIRACPLSERCEAPGNGCYWSGVQPNANGTCSEECGQKVCPTTEETSGNNGGGGEGGN